MCCRDFSRVLLTAFLLFIFAFSLVAQVGSDSQKLELGKPIERELAGGQSHSYEIVLNSGEYVHVVIDQRGIDVVVTLFAPDGKQIAEVDSPNGTQGVEPVFAIATITGIHRLEVRSLEKSAATGRYQVKIEELRIANDQDTNRIAADLAFKDAELLRDQGTAQSLRSSIKKYEEAVALYRTAKYRTGEAIGLNAIGYVYARLDEKSQALDYYQQALTIVHAIGDRGGEAATLNNIGHVYDSLGQKEQALNSYRQSLAISNQVGDLGGQAATLNNLGLVYDSLGQKRKALDFYQQALPLVRSIGDRSGEATTLSNIGAVYDSLGEKQKAIDYLEQALPLKRTIGDRRGEAITLTNLGAVYDDLGENQKAIDYYQKALPLLRTVGSRGGEATTLNNIGLVYKNWGDQQKALEFFGQALSIVHAVGSPRSEAVALTNISSAFNWLGDDQKSLEYLRQALSLYRAAKDRGGEASTLRNIGAVYSSSGDLQKALEYYDQALPIHREVGDRNGEATTLNNIGRVRYQLGEQKAALDWFDQALQIRRAVGDRRGEAITLNNFGATYDLIGEKRKALDYYLQALSLRRAVRDRGGEATTLGNMMKIYVELGNPRLATFLGKQSVNVYQQLRSNIKGLDVDTQRSYLKTIEGTYRSLVELLITQGRLAEAQQALNAFKDQESFDFDQTQPRHLRLLIQTPREAYFSSGYQGKSDAAGAASSGWAEIKRQIGSRQPDNEEVRKLQEFEGQLKTSMSDFAALFKRAETEFSSPIDEKDKTSDVSDMTEMQAMLREVNQQTKQEAVAVYTMVGEKKFTAIVVTVNSVLSISTPIKGAELNEKARQLWAVLQSSDYDPRLLSAELYNVIFKPLEDKLPPTTKTILWSLDDTLRYLPMAALFDGKQYLVERFSHVVFTRADKERLTRSSSLNWTAYCFATSTAHKVELRGKAIEFAPLDFVNDEVRIFRTKTHPDGLIEGEVFPEGEFNKASLLASLKQTRPLVHISSHFRFRPGDAANSFLLLGDDQVMTLAEIKEQANLFLGTELLTLSACDTAAQRPDASGKEVDGFAELAQRLGAGGVMASLWTVVDRSTAQLMKAFYEHRQVGKYSKAEALRQAQLDLLNGPSPSRRAGITTSTTRGSRTEDGDVVLEPKFRIPFKVDKERPFAHPYYWAPFVLFGNWK